MCETQRDHDQQSALRLLRNGWRQASVFRPPPGVALGKGIFDAGEEWLVICTQSCSVVSPRFDTDPFVEVLVARPLQSLNPKSPQAKGGDARHLHLPVEGGSITALDCDINRRFTISRRMIADWDVSRDINVNEGDSRKLAGWLGRYYTRLAFPNELVTRMRASGLTKIMDKVFKSEHQGNPAHEGIDLVYVQWLPEHELGSQEEEPYSLNVIFLCNDEAVREHLDRSFIDKVSPWTGEKPCGGIRMTVEVTKADQIFFSNLDGFTRWSDWDALTDLSEVADIVANER